MTTLRDLLRDMLIEFYEEAVGVIDNEKSYSVEKAEEILDEHIEIIKERWVG